VLLTLAFTAVLCGSAQMLEAQQAPTWRYQVGGRTTFMLRTMQLSELGAPFEELTPGSDALPHSSGFFVLWPRGEHVRLGLETMVGNSYGDEDTNMLFQGAGFIAEYQTSGVWFVGAALHVGGIVVSATQPTTSSGPGPVRAGASYKGSGLFGAPMLSVGRLFGSKELRVVGRQVWHLPGTEHLDAFDSFYLGIGFGFRR
jgi:hypothetical protein